MKIIDIGFNLYQFSPVPKKSRGIGYNLRLLAAILFALVALSSCSSKETNEVFAKRLADYADAQFTPSSTGALVLVAKGAKPIFQRAYGMADIDKNQPMRLTQPLPIGSLTKSFTAGAILRLVQTGKLSLKDDVRLHYADAPVGDKLVTIEQLLTHTSGIPSLVDVKGFFEWAKEKRSTDQLLELTRGLPFLFEPGEGFAYSDTGYILLGAVLENHGKQSWDRVIRDLLTAPMGLASIRSAETLSLAIGYQVSGDKIQPAEPIDWSVPHASGALVATVEDLLIWVRAWRGEAIASAALLKPAWQSRQLPDGSVSGYGYGWKKCDFEQQVAIQHGGWVPGYNASVLHLPELDLTAIVLTNGDGGVEASYLARRLLRLLVSGAAEPVELVKTAAELSLLSGEYVTKQGTLWTVTVNQGKLQIDFGAKPHPLVALTENKFCAADSDGTWCFIFQRKANGHASEVARSLSCEPQGRAQWLKDENKVST